MIFVNLPVADVERAAAFYEAVGFTRDPRFSQAHVTAAMQWSDEIVFMLLGHARFADFAKKPRADAHAATGALYCLSIDSREAVDAIVAKAEAAGGVADPLDLQDYGVMYGRSFDDLDGHVFEPMWMDVDAMLASMGQQQAA
jgi:predicted lactoylglutathione lyase